MSILKKTGVGMAILTAINVFSIGCFAMEKRDIEKNVVSKNEKQEKNNINGKNNKFYDDESLEGYNFFGVEPGKNSMLGKKIKEKRQVETVNDREDKFKKPCFDGINSINLIGEEDVNNKKDENIDCFKFKADNAEYENNKTKGESRLHIPIEYVESDFNFKKGGSDIYVPVEYMMYEKNGIEDKEKMKSFSERISKMLKQPFNVNFFEESNMLDWGIPEKLKFIVDEYKKDILDYLLRDNIKEMYNKYINDYLKRKGIEKKHYIGVTNNYYDFYRVKQKLLKNSITITIPEEFFCYDDVDIKELLKELTIKAKVILGSAAAKTKKDLENISDKDFEDIKFYVLKKRRHFEEDEDLKGCWGYIKEGLKQLKKEDLCFSYLDDPDNFINRVGYQLKIHDYDGNISSGITSYLYISNKNGLKIYKEEGQLVEDIQFEEFNMEKAFSLADQKNPGNIKKEDMAKYLFLEDRDEKNKQFKLVKDEFKKLIFVDRLTKNIEANVNALFDDEKNNIQESITISSIPINSKERSDKLRKTGLYLFFPLGLNRNQAIEYSKKITSNMKKIIGKAVVQTKKEFAGENIFNFENVNGEKLRKKEFKNYVEKRLKKEEVEEIFKELEKIKCEDILSIMDFFKNFENFVDTINFKYLINNKGNLNGTSKLHIGPLIYGEDLNKEYWEGRAGDLKGFKIYFDNTYNLEEELKKSE